MNFLDALGSTLESSFGYVRNFVVCSWETFCDLLVPSGGRCLIAGACHMLAPFKSAVRTTPGRARNDSAPAQFFVVSFP